MAEFKIRDKCSINTNIEADTFVGLKSEKGNISVHFPLGYDLANDENELRKDILLLISTIATTTAKRDSSLLSKAKEYNEVSFPIQAYLFLIHDFYANGYYVEREVKYVVSKKGKINWNRTIKTQKPYLQEGEAFYLDFVVKKNEINANELITLIHEYCVYESFEKMGWLFTSNLPSKPRTKLNRKLFRTVVINKLNQTFNDKNKKLFQNMLAIIDNLGDDAASKSYVYGTYRFEYVWEALIDRIYGIKGKSDYFPKTQWNIDEKTHDNACLEPDSIMLCNGNVYILDAKYYKYGATGRNGDLPGTTSISKQITYGEYVATEKHFKEKHGENFKIYNAFIMPYNSEDYRWGQEGRLKNIGEATSSWKTNDVEYEKVQGILLDVKHLMKIRVRQSEDEIIKLAECIENRREVKK